MKQVYSLGAKKKSVRDSKKEEVIREKAGKNIECHVENF
jgi:hypothetical protein